jgi:hypothetical protein
MDGKTNVNYQFFTYYEALASKMNNKISLPPQITGSGIKESVFHSDMWLVKN